MKIATELEKNQAKTAENPSKEEQESRSTDHNAVKIVLTERLSEGDKQYLKTHFNTHWNGDVLTAPKEHKILIEDYLKTQGIACDLHDTCEWFYTLSQEEQKASKLFDASNITAKQTLPAVIYLQKYIDYFNLSHETTLSEPITINALEGKTIEEVRGLATSEDPVQIERLSEIFKMYSKIHPNLVKAKRFIKKAENLKETRKKPKSPWDGIEIPTGYELDKKGVWKITSKKKKNSETKDDPTAENNETKIKICAPVWVAGRSRDYDGSNSGLIVRWIDMDAIIREQCIERRKLHTTGNPIAEDLAHNNLMLIPGREKDLSKYLSEFETDKTYRAVKSLGWLENPVGDLIYVSKGHTFRNSNSKCDEEIVFQPHTTSSGPSAIDCKGTLEEWKENIATPCRGNELPIFLQSISLSGTIIKFADIGSSGVHVPGTTSRGKTTAAQTGTSVIACGADPAYAPKLSWIKRWLATANALESLASQSTDSVLVLDEIGQCPGSDLDKVIYNLFGGRGKERLSQQSQHKETRDWCTAVISTGEKTIAERLKETNSKAPAGLFVRFIDLHFEEVFTNYHGEDHKSFVDKLKVNCGLYYGTPASAFIQKIVDTYKSYQDLRESIAKGCASIAREIAGNASLSQEHSRVLKIFSFAALAGSWASEWNIFPYTGDEVVSAARNLFLKWQSSNQKQSEDILCICAIRDYYLKKRDSAFRPRYLHVNDARRYGDVFGYTTAEGKFFLTREGLEQALGHLPKKTALKALLAKGYLLREESPSRNDSKKSIDGIDGAPRVFVISEQICEFDGESA